MGSSYNFVEENCLTISQSCLRIARVYATCSIVKDLTLARIGPHPCRKLLTALALISYLSTPAAAENFSQSTRTAIGIAVAAGMIEANDCPDYQVNKVHLDDILAQSGIRTVDVDRKYLDIAAAIAKRLADDYHLDPAKTCSEIWATLGDNGILSGVVERRK